MPAQSRRKFLQYGSATVGVALTPSLLSGTASAQPAAAGPLPEQSLVAYVRDYKTGEIVVMVGEHEVFYRDPKLATRLARIASHAPRA